MQLLDYLAEHVASHISSDGFELQASESSRQYVRHLRRGNLCIALSVHPATGEVGVSLIDTPSGEFAEFWVLTELSGDKRAALVGKTSVQTIEDVIAAVDLIAAGLASHRDLLFDWDRGTAAKLFQAQRTHAEEAWRKQCLAAALRAADICWTQKRYADCAEQLRLFKELLSPASLKRLLIAEARSTTGA